MAIHDGFTELEINYLIDNYTTESWENLINGINQISPFKRDKSSLITKASELGIKRSGVKFSCFTTEEDDLIRHVYDTYKCSEIGEALEKMVKEKMPYRTVLSVRNRASRLGLKIREFWSDDEINFLKENYYIMSCDIIAEKLGRTYEAVYNMVRKLKLIGAPRSKYTEKDAEYVINNYLTMTDEEIGRALHRARASIKEYRRKLGLKRPVHRSSPYGFDEFIHRNNNDWKKESAKHCDYKCVISGEPFDDIHHIYAKSLIIGEVIDEHPEVLNMDFSKMSDDEKTEIASYFRDAQAKYPLGLCLTKQYHKKFHDEYGYGDNTPQQFYEFVKNVAPGRLDYIMSLTQ